MTFNHVSLDAPTLVNGEDVLVLGNLNPDAAVVFDSTGRVFFDLEVLTGIMGNLVQAERETIPSNDEAGLAYIDGKQFVVEAIESNVDNLRKESGIVSASDLVVERLLAAIFGE